MDAIPVSALRYTGKVATSVLPSPVRISAIALVENNTTLYLNGKWSCRARVLLHELLQMPPAKRIQRLPVHQAVFEEIGHAWSSPSDLFLKSCARARTSRTC